MSGIFGIMTGSVIPDISALMSRLQKWNGVFGEDQQIEKSDERFALGIYADHISNAPLNKTPILHRDDLCAVIDALIYNREDICNDFNISTLYSDEELLFELISKYGMDSLKKVNGDFSGAVYDTVAKKITLFTDHIGIHPLFYYRSSDLIAFSSEIRGLINLPQVPGEINPKYLYNMLNGYINSSLTTTEFSDVFMVKPGTYLDITTTDNELRLVEHTYWQLKRKKIFYTSEEKYIGKMRELITQAVNRRLDVFPGAIGAELSGGLDSGVIDILINRHGRDAVYFSWSNDPKDVPVVENDERLVIQDICEQEKITCHYRSLDSDEGNINIIRKNEELGFLKNTTESCRFSFAYPLYINTEFIGEAAQFVHGKGANVIFSGHGGDEGVSHRCDPYELYYSGEKIHFAKCLWDNNRESKNRIMKTIRDYRYKVSRGHSYHNEPYVDKTCRAPLFLKKEFAEKYNNYRGIPYYFHHDVISYILTGATNNRLNVTAFLGPYAGARYVFPYLDHEVLEYAVSIPRHLYIRKGQKRYIFRQAFKDIMPRSLYLTTDKSTPSMDGSLEDQDDWFENISKWARSFYDALDRDYWEKYLDFDELRKIRDSREPRPEERQSYLSSIYLMGELVQFQNVIKKVKNL